MLQFKGRTIETIRQKKDRRASGKIAEKTLLGGKQYKLDNTPLIIYEEEIQEGEDMVKVKLIKAIPKIEIKEGFHEGEITKVFEPEGEFRYLYVAVTCDELKTDTGELINLQYSAPINDSVSENSKLAELLNNFGVKVSEQIGKDIDIDKILKIGTKVQYITYKNKRGYTEIVKGTLRPKA